MITVHHLDNSRSQRILWLLEELGVDYEVKHYKRNAETNLAPPELVAIHPLGKAPVVTDGDNTLAESGAIVEYLVERYGNGRLAPPPDSPERLQYRFWLHYAEGSFMPLMLLSLIFSRIEQAPLIVRPVAKGIAGKVRHSFLQPNIERHLNFMENTLTESAWFAGDKMTAADIQMSFPVEAAAVRTDLSGNYPKLRGYLERIHANPAYQRALEKGGPYDLMR